MLCSVSIDAVEPLSLLAVAESSPTNFRAGSVSSYFATLVSMYLPPALRTWRSSPKLGEMSFFPCDFCQLIELAGAG